MWKPPPTYKIKLFKTHSIYFARAASCFKTASQSYKCSARRNDHLSALESKGHRHFPRSPAPPLANYRMLTCFQATRKARLLPAPFLWVGGFGTLRQSWDGSCERRNENCHFRSSKPSLRAVPMLSPTVCTACTAAHTQPRPLPILWPAQAPKRWSLQHQLGFIYKSGDQKTPDLFKHLNKNDWYRFTIRFPL